ncbi:unnamed protein product [Strongylus vulgaris]|uniref:Uncharacterized protein n=1 Tax=Strongylus vulgaris TaxID=40348 RepID=A0A3P7KCE5_STRVU|nr:unnamed protein product [Strongylus vulgaris]
MKPNLYDTLDFATDLAAWITLDGFEDYRGLSRVPPTSRPNLRRHGEAFDSIETNAILSALVDQRVDLTM